MKQMGSCISSIKQDARKRKKKAQLHLQSVPGYELTLCRPSAEYLFVASSPRCQTFMTHFSSRYLQWQLGACEFEAGNMEVLSGLEQTQDGSH